jgi:hypothetical protein
LKRLQKKKMMMRKTERRRVSERRNRNRRRIKQQMARYVKTGLKSNSLPFCFTSFSFSSFALTVNKKKLG